jgi:hypothetical protein
MSDSMQNLLAGGLAGYMMGKKKENFASGSKTALIVFLVIIVIIWILLVVSTFLLMGGGVAGGLHAFMTLLLGSGWITLVWMYKAFTGAKFTK